MNINSVIRAFNWRWFFLQGYGDKEKVYIACQGTLCKVIYVNDISICSLYSILMLLWKSRKHGYWNKWKTIHMHELCYACIKMKLYFLWTGPHEWNVEDMYKMIWQEKTNTIVMLANVYEMGKVGYLKWLNLVLITFKLGTFSMWFCDKIELVSCI